MNLKEHSTSTSNRCFTALHRAEMAAEPSLEVTFYTTSQVASILQISDDTVLKQFGNLEGVIDIGTPGGMHKRRKRVLRISPRTLERFIASKQVRVRH